MNMTAKILVVDDDPISLNWTDSSWVIFRISTL